MNVTIVCEVLGKANNGTTVAALNLIRSLKEKGHNVKVICPDADREGLEGYYILPVTNMGGIINGILEKNHVTLAKYDVQIIYDAIKENQNITIPELEELCDTGHTTVKKMLNGLQ